MVNLWLSWCLFNSKDKFVCCQEHPENSRCIFVSINIVLELLGYKMYECNLINNDGKSVERTIISKKNLLVCKGEEVKIVTLNNEFWLDK